MILSLDSLDVAGSLLAPLVFLAETCVVTLGTVRTIFIARGMKLPASLLGFFEVSIWLFAIGQIMQHLSSLDCYVAFAGGFSLGNYLGVSIEKKLALGAVVVHVTTQKNPGELIEGLKANGFGSTTLDAQGLCGPVRVVVTAIKRRELARVISLIHGFDDQAFYSVHDLQAVARGIFPATPSRTKPGFPPLSWQTTRVALREVNATKDGARFEATIQETDEVILTTGRIGKKAEKGKLRNVAA